MQIVSLFYCELFQQFWKCWVQNGISVEYSTLCVHEFASIIEADEWILRKNYPLKAKKTIKNAKLTDSVLLSLSIGNNVICHSADAS